MYLASISNQRWRPLYHHYETLLKPTLGWWPQGYREFSMGHMEQTKVRWIKRQNLDDIVDSDAALKTVCILKDILRQYPTNSLTLDYILDRENKLNASGVLKTFIGTYPLIFREFYNSEGDIGFRLSEYALAIDDEEQKVHEQYEMDAVCRLCKLLMMTRTRKLPLRCIEPMKYELGLPRNYVRTLIPKYSDYLRVIKMENHNAEVKGIRKKKRGFQKAYIRDSEDPISRHEKNVGCFPNSELGYARRGKEIKYVGSSRGGNGHSAIDAFLSSRLRENKKYVEPDFDDMIEDDGLFKDEIDVEEDEIDREEEEFVGEEYGLSLVKWNDKLAVSAAQKNAMEKKKKALIRRKKRDDAIAFDMDWPEYFRGNILFRDYMDQWQKLPYISPYVCPRQAGGMNKWHVRQKRDVGVLHELLSLTLTKRLQRDDMFYFSNELHLQPSFPKKFTRFPGIFYYTLKRNTTSVLLTEAYANGRKPPLHPVQKVRMKYYHLMGAGRQYYNREMDMKTFEKLFCREETGEEGLDESERALLTMD